MKNIFRRVFVVAVTTTSATAFAGISFAFNPTAVAAPGGPNTTTPFITDEIRISSIDNSTVTLRDTSAPYGTTGIADDLVEATLFSVVNFRNKGVNINSLTSGVNLYL